MKRLLSVVLVALLLFTACGSGVKKPLTFEEFQEKYKRSEWGSLLNDPVTFYKDFESGKSLSREEWAADWSVFKQADYADDAKVSDVVLFNRPFEVHIWDSKTATFGGMIEYESEDRGECFAAFSVMFDSVIKKLGDPSQIAVNFEDISEAEFRKVLGASPKDYDYYNIKWQYDGGQLVFTYSDFSSHATIQFATN